MKVLRDLRLSTELLILFEIMDNPHTKLKAVAEKLDITVQGASDYLRRMKREGLIQNIGGEYRVTKKGIDFLHSNFSELKRFVDSKITELNIIDVCSALAKTPVKKGDEVGIFMEGGVLTAYAGRESSSRGTAFSDADVDEDVAVTDLDGIVSLSPGTIHIMSLPSIREGGSAAVSSDNIKQQYKKIKPDKVGVLDVVSLAAVKKADLKPDFEFGTLPASIEAIEKGLDVMLFASRDSVHTAVSTIEDINSQIEDKIVYKVVYLD
ncbi:MAG: winged helix-turn-helix transcriptional regulator [Thermoplasmata archaeon]|nr:MAG: winged helix-turn-helix transcriptional regulator [Thermoplasmata archaeon]